VTRPSCSKSTTNSPPKHSHAIAAFAELERAPEHVHSYRLTPLGLWNARAAGLDAEKVLDTLLKYSRFPVPHSLLIDVEETMSRYGRLRLEKDPAARPGHAHI
jgi:DNA excision repair protein ERCC-3